MLTFRIELVKYLFRSTKMKHIFLSSMTNKHGREIFCASDVVNILKEKANRSIFFLITSFSKLLTEKKWRNSKRLRRKKGKRTPQIDKLFPFTFHTWHKREKGWTRKLTLWECKKEGKKRLLDLFCGLFGRALSIWRV